jgi:hypothetical protein
MDSLKFLILIKCSPRSPRNKIKLILRWNRALLCTQSTIWMYDPIILIFVIEKYFKTLSIQTHLANAHKSTLCLTTGQKRTVHFWAALHFFSIANFVASWLKWLQMISNDSKWLKFGEELQTLGLCQKSADSLTGNTPKFVCLSPKN